MTSSSQLRNKLVIAVLGSTGVGKSKLGIQIASAFNGEVISADSMQVYRCLDTISNKVTADEQRQCRHHLLGFLSADQQYDATRFQRDARSIVDRLCMEAPSKLPVIVGGTYYYVEAFLWDFLLNSDGKKATTDTKQLHNKTNEELYAMLESADSETARRLHVNDRRKVLRALQVLQQHGTTMSSLLADQRSKVDGSSIGGPLVYPNSLVFHLDCDRQVLDERINRRTDQMVAEGLKEELLQFLPVYQRLVQAQDPDNRHGVLQMIGLRQFDPWFEAISRQDSDESTRNKLFDACVEQLKDVTKAYSRSQERWIRNRFLRRSLSNRPAIYKFSTTNPLNWDEEVWQPVASICQSFLDGKQGLDLAVRPVELVNENDSNVVRRICNVCDNQVFIFERHWLEHLRSRRHKKRHLSWRKQAARLSATLNGHVQSATEDG